MNHYTYDIVARHQYQFNYSTIRTNSQSFYTIFSPNYTEKDKAINGFR